MFLESFRGGEVEESLTMCLDNEALERLRNLGGETLLRKMIDAFLDSSPERVASAVAGSTDGDPELVERAAHSLKSSSANFGATRLVELAAEIERQAAAGQARELQGQVQEMLGAFEQVRQRLIEVRKGLDE